MKTKQGLILSIIFWGSQLFAEAFRPPDMSNLLAIKEVVSASKFGVSASASGTTNKVALDLAVAASNGKNLVFPSGTFELTFANTPPNNYILLGHSITHLKISGAGIGKTILRMTNTVAPSGLFAVFNDAVTTGTDTLRFILEDLTIEGPSNPYPLTATPYETYALAGMGYYRTTYVYLNRVVIGKNLGTSVDACGTIIARDSEFWSDHVGVAIYGQNQNNRNYFENCKFRRAAYKVSSAHHGVMIYCHPEISITCIGCDFGRPDRYPTYTGNYSVQFYGSSAINTGAIRYFSGCTFDSTANGLNFLAPGCGKTIFNGNFVYCGITFNEGTISNNLFIGPKFPSRNLDLTLTNHNYGAGPSLGEHRSLDDRQIRIKVSDNIFRNYGISMGQGAYDPNGTGWFPTGGECLIEQNDFAVTDEDSMYNGYILYGNNEYTTNAYLDSMMVYKFKNNTFSSNGKVAFAYLRYGRYLFDGNEYTLTGKPHGTTVTSFGSAFVPYQCNEFRQDNPKFFAKDSTWLCTNYFVGNNAYIEGQAYNDAGTRIGFTTIDKLCPFSLTVASTVAMIGKYNRYYIDVASDSTINTINFIPSGFNFQGYRGTIQFISPVDSFYIGNAGNIKPKSTAKRGFPSIVNLRHALVGGAYKWIEY
jgi:hypothetical protein